MSDEADEIRRREREDRRLLQRAADALAEIDRDSGLSDEHADVLAALRIRIEGKQRTSLEDLLSSAGEIAGKRDLGDVLGAGEPRSSEWPDVTERRRDWPEGRP